MNFPCNLDLMNVKLYHFFNAFTGCDHTFSMLDIGKKSGWNAWMKFPDATETMISLTESPHELTEDSLHMQRIEQLTVLMYSKKYSSVSLNEARRHLLTLSLRSLDTSHPQKQPCTSMSRELFLYQLLFGIEA